jgi:hypothetical protein
MNCQARREASSRSALALRRRICKTAWRKERAADFANAAGASLALLSGGLGGWFPEGVQRTSASPSLPQMPLQETQGCTLERGCPLGICLLFPG